MLQSCQELALLSAPTSPLLHVCPTRGKTQLLELGESPAVKGGSRPSGSRGEPRKQEQKLKRCWVGGDRQTPSGECLHPCAPQHPGCTLG